VNLCVPIKWGLSWQLSNYQVFKKVTSMAEISTFRAEPPGGLLVRGKQVICVWDIFIFN
jgi:hypothetical protein